MNKDVYEKLKVMSRLLKEQYEAIHVIVFGSYATGKETEESDIDLLVVALTDENVIDRMLQFEDYSGESSEECRCPPWF